MINGEKTGVGIITFNRPKLLEKCYKSVEPCNSIDEIIIVNDGDDIITPELNKNTFYHKNDKNLGVGKSKNIALRYLLKKGCEHVFLIEDDIFVKRKNVFKKYVEASKITGIQHFNYSQHGVANRQRISPHEPMYRCHIKYGDCGIMLFPHCIGAFSYYSKKCLETVGLLDEEYFNACEHVDHTYRIIKEGMHPPFWWFADIENSWEYLGDEPWSIQNSTISSSPNHKQIMQNADMVFLKKHNHFPTQTPMVPQNMIGTILKNIRTKYGRSNDSNM